MNKTTIDCQFTEEIVCPYCGYELSDSFEYDFEDTGGNMECPNCDKSFLVDVHRQTNYSTAKADCLNDGCHRWAQAYGVPRGIKPMNETFEEDLKSFIDNPDAWEEEKRRETVGDDAHKALFSLANELEAEDPIKYEMIIERCRNGHYHDFASTVAAPKMEMHQDLLALGLTIIDKRMQNGEFDS